MCSCAHRSLDRPRIHHDPKTALTKDKRMSFWHSLFTGITGLDYSRPKARNQSQCSIPKPLEPTPSRGLSVVDESKKTLQKDDRKFKLVCVSLTGHDSLCSQHSRTCWVYLGSMYGFLLFAFSGCFKSNEAEVLLITFCWNPSSKSPVPRAIHARMFAEHQRRGLCCKPIFAQGACSRAQPT